MSDWRTHIISEFIPGLHRLTLADDPDGLLADERLQAMIRKRGFEILRFDEEMAFRYAYESRFRARWDRGEQANLTVVLGAPAIDSLPFDILSTGYPVALGLNSLFPSLSRSVVAEINVADLDALWDAYQQHQTGVLGDNATKDFVLRHVYAITPEAIAEPHDLLHILLRRHYAQQRIPPLHRRAPSSATPSER